jgi:glycosyltransferase involved in cell wall biosynthesis
MVETGGWGGIAHYAWNLSQALAQAGTEVVLMTNTRYELAALPTAFRVEPVFQGGVDYLRTARAFLHRLSAEAPDIVHVQSLISTRFDAFLWPMIRRRLPLVMTAHNVRTHEGFLWETWTMWRSLRAANAVIVHTLESLEVASRRLGPAARIALIHHGDYAFFDSGAPPEKASARRQLGLPVDARILLMFGAIRPYKGILGAIAALPRIRQHHPAAHLVIAGPLLFGREREYVNVIERSRLADAVTFRPRYVPHDEVASYFAAADVAVYNYSEVTDSGSLRLACGFGTPVVATAVGAFREFLADGVSARLVPPNAPERLAAAVTELLADPAAAARMADAARALVRSRWSWSASARATLELYQSILGGSQ